MKRLFLTLILLVSCEQRPQCLKQVCHNDTEIVLMPDGNGGLFPIPMTVEHCDCIAYADAGK